jgi:hypothetical protein
MKKMIFAALFPILLMVAIPVLEFAGLMPDAVSAFLFNNMVAIGIFGLAMLVLTFVAPFVIPKIMDMFRKKNSG